MICFLGPLCAAAALAAPPVPVVEVIKVYGKLAGPECFGATVPASSGASCQLPMARLQEELGLSEAPVDEAQFAQALDALPFRWPLKPFGVAASESNARTVKMNKNAETAVYNGELESRGLYDPHNPATPLPTSLRPALDAALQREPVSPEAAALVFRTLSGGATTIDGRRVVDLLGPEPLDYFSYLALVGAANVAWPR